VIPAVTACANPAADRRAVYT